MARSIQSVDSDGFSDEHDTEELRRENAELLLEIAELCSQRDENEVENIILLGMPGVGKSALVNTVIKVLAGQHIRKAEVGSGTTVLKTVTLKRFKSCGVTEKDFIADSKCDIVNTILPKLPTIFDAAGVQDSFTEEMEEILELLIGGFIPPNTSIIGLVELQREYGVGCLRDVFYAKSKKEWKMTKVVFVQSCLGHVPFKLIRCLDKILRKMDPRTVLQKYPVDVFVLITKYDLVKESGHPEGGLISMEALKRIEDSLAKEFSIEGALRDNMMRWISYSDGTVPDSPYIDNIALKFLKRMMVPRNMKTEVTTPVITTWKLWKVIAKNKWNEQIKKGSVSCAVKCVLIIIVVIVAILLGKLLKRRIN